MAITRSDIAGALKVLNASNITDRKKHLKSMLAKEHGAKDVSKVLSDLETYPEWAARMDLEVPAASESAVPVKKKKGVA